jgi:hypothetical protein
LGWISGERAMPLNLPAEIWILFAAAAAFVVVPLMLIYVAYRALR